MDYIQSKVEEILYQYVGIPKPVKEKIASESLEIDTDQLMPTDLEQVSPDSDKKSSLSDMLLDESQGEQVEEEVVDDDDFESPAFEPIEVIKAEKSENSNLSSISGLTSHGSSEEKVEESMTVQDQPQQQDSQLSQFSSVQDMSEEVPEPESAPSTILIGEGAQAEIDAMETQEAGHVEPEKSNFDLKKDAIEFTGTERKSMPLDDSTNSTEVKVFQSQDVPSNTMEIDNLYENDTTDSSEMRMEIDLKDDTTQETADSSKVEESSQDSTVSKEKPKAEHKKDSDRHRKSERSGDKHKSSSYRSKHDDKHRSSSSKTRHDDKYKSKSTSSSHKRSTSDRDKDRSSSRRRDHDKEKKSSRDDDKSKHRDKKSDDHNQEKPPIRKPRKSTDHDSNEGKNEKAGGSSRSTAKPESEKNPETAAESEPPQNAQENKSTVVDAVPSENREVSIDSKSSTSTSSGPKKEQKSSILIKYDYLKASKSVDEPKNKIEDGFCGFAAEKLPENPWIEYMRQQTAKIHPGNSNLEVQIPKAKPKGKSKQLDSPSEAAGDSPKMNGLEEISSESKAQHIAQQQRYSNEDLYKPRFDFGNRSRRRGQVTEETSDDAQKSNNESVAN